MKKVLLFFLIIFPWALSYGQIYQRKQNHFAINLELGPNFITGELNDNWPVRHDVGNYNEYYFERNGKITTKSNLLRVGVKPEYVFANGRLGVISGLRYTHFNGRLAKNDDGFGYFYLRYTNDETNSKYARVKNITENQHYIGIPLELRWTFLQYTNLGFFVKVGADINVNLSADVDINFENKSMNVHEDEMLNFVGIKTNKISSSYYSTVGATLKMNESINLGFEVFFPSYFATTNNFALITPEKYGGFQFSLQFSLEKDNSTNLKRR